MRRVLEPDELLRWRFYLREPFGRDLGVDVEVVASSKDDERAVQSANLGQVEAQKTRQEVRRGEFVALPDARDLVVGVVRRQVGKRALGGVVPPESHRATVVAEPLSLGVEVLERC